MVTFWLIMVLVIMTTNIHSLQSSQFLVIDSWWEKTLDTWAQEVKQYSTVKVECLIISWANQVGPILILALLCLCLLCFASVVVADFTVHASGLAPSPLCISSRLKKSLHVLLYICNVSSWAATVSATYLPESLSSWANPKQPHNAVGPFFNTGRGI